MSFEIRAATDADVDEVFRADGRAFGFVPTPEEVAERRGSLELDRFRLAVEDGKVVGTSGAFTLQLTVPGGGAVRASGVTWVGVQPTHRRRGLMRSMLAALHDDARERGEPVAILTASESGIYERLGYGVASHLRMAAITKHQASLRPTAPGGGGVRYVDDPAELRTLVPALYDRYRCATVGEISRSPEIWDLIFAVRTKELDGLSPAFWLLHPDGYACYRIEQRWHDGHPAHRLELTELMTLTDAARGALWRMLLSIDLVGEITTRAVPLDDPLPYWLEEPRAIRTTTYNDWLWVKPLDPVALLTARTFGVDGRVVLEVGAARYRIDVDDGRATVTKVRSRPDTSTDDAGLGAVLLGGVRPSTLARGGRLVATGVGVLRRLDAMFAGERLPYSQTPF